MIDGCSQALMGRFSNLSIYNFSPPGSVLLPGTISGMYPKAVVWSMPLNITVRSIVGSCS